MEPIPGWVDNLNGPVGLLIAAGKGVVRSMYCNGEYHAELIPVDLAINALIGIAHKITLPPKKYVLQFIPNIDRCSAHFW